MSNKVRRYYNEIKFKCLQRSPGFTVGEEYYEHEFMDSEYDEYSIFDPNDFPTYFAKTVNKRWELVEKGTENALLGAYHDKLLQETITANNIFFTYASKERNCQ